jgi:hypothetical protein
MDTFLMCSFCEFFWQNLVVHDVQSFVVHSKCGVQFAKLGGAQHLWCANAVLELCKFSSQ